MKEHPDASEARFYVKTEWTCQDEGDGGGFYVRSSCKDFQLGDQTIQRNNTYAMVFDFPPEFSGEGKGPTVCEACMSSLGACITQTIVAHATARRINIDSVTIDFVCKLYCLLLILVPLADLGTKFLNLKNLKLHNIASDITLSTLLPLN